MRIWQYNHLTDEVRVKGIYTLPVPQPTYGNVRELDALGGPFLLIPPSPIRFSKYHHIGCSLLLSRIALHLNRPHATPTHRLHSAQCWGLHGEVAPAVSVAVPTSYAT